MDVFRVGLGLENAPLLECRRERERADDVAVDVVLAPLGGGHAGQPADALLGGGVGALAEIAEQSRSGGKIDDAALRLFQIRIAFAHAVAVAAGDLQDGLKTRLLEVDAEAERGCLEAGGLHDVPTPPVPRDGARAALPRGIHPGWHKIPQIIVMGGNGCVSIEKRDAERGKTWRGGISPVPASVP